MCIVVSVCLGRPRVRDKGYIANNETWKLSVRDIGMQTSNF